MTLFLFSLLNCKQKRTGNNGAKKSSIHKDWSRADVYRTLLRIELLVPCCLKKLLISISSAKSKSLLPSQGYSLSSVS